MEESLCGIVYVHAEILTVIVILKVMLIEPSMLCPASVADSMAEPIALYVVSDSVWLSLIGNRVLSAYKMKRTPVLLLVIFSNVLAGIVMAFNDALVFTSEEFKLDLISFAGVHKQM